MIREGKRGKRSSSLLLAVVLLLAALLSACGGGSNSISGGSQQGNAPNASSNSQQGSPSADEPPTEIRIMVHFFGATPPASDNAVKLKIEEATNTKLDIQWVSANNYKEKFNVTLASGDIPDLILVTDPFDPVFRRAAEQGAFWDVSPYIDEYSYMKETIAPIAWDMTKINGKNYGLPRPRPSEGEAFFIVRKDWLDNLGLSVPETAEQLYEVMKAFTTQDPDKNSKDDTIGLAGQVDGSSMSTLAEFERIFYQAYGNWKLQDGQLVHVVTLPETREALVMLAQAYAEGLIPLDFASMKLSQVKDMFKAGQAGIIVEKSGALQEYYDALKKIDPNFDMKNLLPLTSVNGYNPKGPGFSGVIAIPKSVSEDKLKKILAALDRWSQDDLFLMHSQGIEGIHHTVQDGKIVIDTEKVTADGLGEFNQILYVADPYASTVKRTFPEDVQELYASIQDERAKTSVANVGTGLYSETGATFMQEFNKTVQDLKTKIILGVEPIEAWDAFVASLDSNESFKKTTAEMNEAYKNR